MQHASCGFFLTGRCALVRRIFWCTDASIYVYAPDPVGSKGMTMACAARRRCWLASPCVTPLLHSLPFKQFLCVGCFFKVQ